MRDTSESTGPGPTATVEALQAELERERERTREIDHRAKNSLQIVSSLLLLMSRRSAQPETQRALKAMHQRISAIAAVHRELLAAPRPDCFELSAFIREHAASLARSQSEGASVQLDLESVEIPASQAGPVALIVNELVLNALAHGTAPGVQPLARISLRKAGEGFVLTVQDDGPGLPDTAPTTGFGLTIAKLLSQQIGARLELQDAGPGVRAVVAV